jgi:hypothetical protein
MPSWSSTPIPQLRVRKVEESIVYELVEGPVGKTGETNLTFGYIDSASVSRYATPADKQGIFATGLTIPAEAMLMDFFVHRSMPEVERLSAKLLTQIPGFGGESGACELPIPIRFTKLAGRPPQSATPLVADYHKLIASVFEGRRWDPADFYGMRMIIEHAPLNSTVLARYDLPTEGA